MQSQPSSSNLTPFYQTLIPLIDFIPLKLGEEQYREQIKQKANELIASNAPIEEIYKFVAQIPLLHETIKLLSKTKQAIQALKDPYNPQTQTITLLKKNLTQYTNQHIERFDEMQKFYIAIGNKPLAWQMGLYKNVFTSFQSNPHNTIKTFGAAS
jgi:hypothetical protein